MSFIDFYHLNPKGQRLNIEQSPVDRGWMDQTAMGYAYRCLPMSYANRHGWCVRLTEDVEATWDGGISPDSTTIIKGREQNGLRMADNGTGNGIVTFHLNAIPRTPLDWNLWIMGAPNLVIPGASALSGIIEADWMFTSPTSNWKITQTNQVVTFKKGDPVLFFVPVHRTEIESFEVNHKSFYDDPEIVRHYNDHANWRNDKEKNGEGIFGKMYMRGVRADGTKPEPEVNHKTRLHLNTSDPNA